MKTGKPYTRKGGAKALGSSVRLKHCQREGADSKRGHDQSGMSQLVTSEMLGATSELDKV